MHYSVLDGYPMRNDFMIHCDMTNAVFRRPAMPTPHCLTVSISQHKAQETVIKELRVFSGAGDLLFLVMNNLARLHQTKSVYQPATILKSGYLYVTRVIPVITVASTSAATVFVNNSIFPYGIPTYLLHDNEQQFVSNFFAAVASRLQIKHLTTTS